MSPLSEEQLSELHYLRGLGYRELIRPDLLRAASSTSTAGKVAPPSVTTAAEQPPQVEPAESLAQEAPLPARVAPVAPAEKPAVEDVVVSVAPMPSGPSREAPAAKETFEQLRLRAEACQACALHTTRKNVVFGSGDPHARLLLIGEGPGAQEDLQGQPFVGPAGELLTRILSAIGLSRESVYIANIVKCRPPGNRDPQPEEVAQCIGYLDAQIDLVSPEVIVLLGKVAAQTLLGMEAPLGRMRGTWHTVRGIPARATYHPAALLRNASFKRPTWEDMQVVRDRLEAR